MTNPSDIQACEGQACENTDRHLWPLVSKPDDPYESIHVTKEGNIGINICGNVLVLPLREWHRRAGGTPGRALGDDLRPSNSLLLHRLRTWNLGDIGRQAADEIERLQQELAPRVCCGDFDNCRRQCIPLVDELRKRATGEPRVDLKRYFQVKPVVVADEPRACRLDFHVGVQTIPIGPEFCEDRDHADWWIDVICKALQNVIAACSAPPPPVAPMSHDELTALCKRFVVEGYNGDYLEDDGFHLAREVEGLTLNRCGAAQPPRAPRGPTSVYLDHLNNRVAPMDGCDCTACDDRRAIETKAGE